VTSAIRRYDYIDAMRGWAILLVMAVHASQLAAVSGLPGKIATQGRWGVQLFYIASALTLMLSWHHRQDGVWPFYLRRLFRIAPMFWLAMPVYLFINGTAAAFWNGTAGMFWAPGGIHSWQIVATALFMHGFHPESINSVVPGGWSIAVEMTFYAVFPLLAHFIRSWQSAVAGVVLSFAFSLMIRPFVAGWWPEEERYLVANFAYLWFPNQFPFFMLGIALYFLTQAEIWAKVPSIRFLKASPIRFIGIVSYSAYLWHFAILAAFTQINLSWAPDGNRLSVFFVSYPCLVIVTAILSSITYSVVEMPMIRLGQKIEVLIGNRFAFSRQ
jgi:peptidoglycan/LPS O-acetylase OafA/YrhL